MHADKGTFEEEDVVEVQRMKAASGLPALRKLEQGELERICQEHKIWLESEGEEGKRADLSRVDLTGRTLRNVNLKRAILKEANLEGITEFSDVKLGGANLQSVKAPKNLSLFETLSNIQEVSKNARYLFIWIILGCLYCWLTIGMTTDTQLLTNSPTSSLPIIGTAIPIVSFYLAAPIFLLAIYFYFHLYIQRLWYFLSSLPAYFPDGRTLDDKVYPWLLNSLVRRHCELLRDNQPSLSRFQTNVSIIFAWGIVPFTVFMFWASYLRRHDWYITAFHALLLAITIVSAIEFYNLAKRTLSGQEISSIKGRKANLILWFMKIAKKTSWIPLFLALLISLWSIEGIPHKGVNLDPRTWVPSIFAKIGFRTFADLEEKDVSTRPEKWTGEEDKLREELAPVPMIPLRHIDLRYAKAKGAFLIKADLRNADLRHATLSESSLQGARLEDADLRGADLREADLQMAILINAKLQGADLKMAKLSGARLRGANLERANLRGANLQDAVFDGANLQRANLSQAILNQATRLDDANLEGANLKFTQGLVPSLLEGSRNWPLAFYDRSFLGRYGKELGLPLYHNDNIQKKNLEKYMLRGADLRGADLRGMNLSKANLEEAMLDKADLRDAKLNGANLRGANLTDANLNNTDIQGSCLDGTILEGADLENANLNGTKGLTKKQFQSAKNYEKAIPPTFPTKDFDDGAQKAETN